MTTKVHVINADQGNMVLIDADDGTLILCDCNVTNDNEARVVGYLKHVAAGRRVILVNSHRDADHMRGINKVKAAVGISIVCDSGRPGGNIYSPEYDEYMRVKRECGPPFVVKEPACWVYGATRIHVLSAGCDDLPDDCNAQSIVLKVQHGRPQNSIILTGDSDAATWERIHRRYANTGLLSSEIFLASHHGSWTFFECNQEGYYISGYIAAVNPAMTLVSVGSNVHGHPDERSLRCYETHSRGSAEGHKVWRTDRDGNMRLELSDGPWVLYRWEVAPEPLRMNPPPWNLPNPYAALLPPPDDDVLPPPPGGSLIDLLTERALSGILQPGAPRPGSLAAYGLRPGTPPPARPGSRPTMRGGSLRDLLTEKTLSGELRPTSPRN